MHWPFEAFIGLRYLRAKRRNGFISFISLISIVGIALGVAALIIVLSVMNGFQKEIRGRILSVASHLEVSTYDGRLDHWRQVAQLGGAQPHVLAAAPFVNGQGLFSAYGNVRGGLVRGIEPALEDKVVDVGRHMVAGKLESLRPGEFGMALGAELARQLNVGLGDKVMLFVPQGTITPAGMLPRSKQFTVVGIFKVDMFEFDASLAMVNLRDAQVLSRMGDSVSGVRFKLDDPMLAPTVKQALRAKLPQNLVTDWTDTNSNYFLAARGQEHQRQIGSLAQAAAQLEAVDVRQAHVQDAQRRDGVVQPLQQRQAALEPLDGEAVGFQGVDQGVGDAGLVLGQPDQRLHGRAAAGASLCGSSRSASALDGENTLSAASSQGSHCWARCSRGASVTVSGRSRHRPNTCSSLWVTPAG